MSRPRQPHPRPRRVRAFGLALLAAVAAVVVFVSPASAGTYSLLQCQGASSEHPDGWQGSNNGAWTYYSSTCSATDGLAAWWDTTVQHPYGDSATESLQAGANTTFTRLRGYRWVNSYPDRPYGSPIAQLGADSSPLEWYDSLSPFGNGPVQGWIDYPLSDASSIFLQVVCGGGPGGICPSGTPAYRLANITITVRDPLAPQLVGTASGSLASQDVLHGTEEISASTSDQGSGVYRIKLLADNVVKDTQIVDSNNGRCADANPNDNDPYEFDHRVPCKLSASGTWGLDTTSMSDGTHNIKVKIEDAAGNETTIVNRTATVDNQPPIVGAVSLDGTAQAGQSLACSASVDGQTPTVAYQWIRTASDGSGQTLIAGASSRSYTLTSVDVGKKVLCRVTAADLGGTSSSTSTLTTSPFDNGATVSAAPVAPAPVSPTTTTTTTTPVSGATSTTSTVPSGQTTSGPGDHVSTTSTTASTSPDPAASSARGTDDTSRPVLKPSNGTNATQTARVRAAWSLGGKGTKATIDYGYKPTIRGTVVNAAGTPIVGAQVDVIAQSVVPGSKPVAKTGLITRTGGQFTYKLPSRVDSRTITFRYRPSLASSVVGGQAAVQLKVRAGVKLTPLGGGHVRSASPTFRFTGRLLGPGVRGQIVEIRVQKYHHWVVVGRPVRVSATGAFRLTYGVAGRIPHGAVFTFRAMSRASKGFGYLTGSSPSTRVTVA